MEDTVTEKEIETALQMALVQIDKVQIEKSN